MLMLFILLFSLTAHSSFFTHDTTFCVGGFNLNNPSSENSHACNKYSIRAQHIGFNSSGWHRHGAILRHIKSKQCYICWDEVDDSCDTDFLRAEGHQFQQIGDYETHLCSSSDPQEVFQHVKHGETLKVTPPPPPKPTKLEPEITIRNGPYATGETLSVNVNLVDDSGNIAKEDGRIITPESATISIVKNGEVISTTQGQTQPDGTFSGDIILPQTHASIWEIFSDPSYTIKVDNVQSNSLPQNYTIATTTDSESIQISDCKHKLHVDLKGQTTIAALIPVTLNAEMTPDHISSSSVQFNVSILDPSTLKNPQQYEWTIPANNGTAEWTPPELTQSYMNTSVQIYASGFQNGVEICPSNTVNATLNGQTILPETLIRNTSTIPLQGVPQLYDQPHFCITGQSCSVAITLTTPPNLQEPLLTDSNSIVKVINNQGDTLYQAPISQNFEYEFTPQKAGVITPKVQLSNAPLNKSASFDSSPITVRDPIDLGLPSVLNFGFVDENNWKDQCHSIDVQKSKLLPKDVLRLEANNFDPECNMELVYLNNPNDPQAVGAPFPITIQEDGQGLLDLLVPTAKEFGICVRTDACGATNSEPDAQLTITPLDASLRQFQSSSQVQWTSEKKPFYSWNCWGKIITYSLGLLIFGSIVQGFATATRFEFHHEVRVSPKKDMSKNVRTYALSEEKRRTLKLFVGERISFDMNFEPTSQKGILTCYARKYGMEVESDLLEEFDTLKRKWHVVESPFLPASNKVYRMTGSKNLYIKFTA